MIVNMEKVQELLEDVSQQVHCLYNFIICRKCVTFVVMEAN